MASVLDQLPDSKLSLQGNGFNPQTNQSSWGYPERSPLFSVNQLDPAESKLQYTYSVDGNPNTYIVDFNRAALGGVTAVRPPSRLDELDRNAPCNTQAGFPSSVVSQIYKSAIGRKYKDLGPQPGRY